MLFILINHVRPEIIYILWTIDEISYQLMLIHKHVTCWADLAVVIDPVSGMKKARLEHVVTTKDGKMWHWSWLTTLLVFLLVTPLIEVCLDKKGISLNVFIGTPLDKKSVMWCTVWNENFWHMFSKKFIVMK